MSNFNKEYYMLYVEGRKSFEMRREKKIMTLPCAEKTHGKLYTLLCAKKINTRQTVYFAVCQKKTHGKVFAVCQHTVKRRFCRVFFFTVRFRRGTLQSGSLPCARQKTHDKNTGTRQTSDFR